MSVWINAVFRKMESQAVLPRANSIVRCSRVVANRM